MYTREELKVACRLYAKGIRFTEIVSLLEEESVSNNNPTISVLFKNVCNYFGTHPNMVKSTELILIWLRVNQGGLNM
jgi:hypothetical protein